MNKNIIRATLYYGIFILYAFLFNIMIEIISIFEKIFSSRFDISNETMNKIGNLTNMDYYCGRAFFVLLNLLGIKINLKSEIKKDRILWICNHRSKFDSLFVLFLLSTHGNKTKGVVKNSIKYIPIIGSFGRNFGAIFIKRDIKMAKETLIKISADSIKDGNSILIFPEWTTMSPGAKFKSDKFSIDHNLPKLSNVMIPKITGFSIIKEHGKFDVVGNMTIHYRNPSINKFESHSYFDLFKKFPSEIDICISYENIEADKLIDTFIKKDKLIEMNDSENNMNNYFYLPKIYYFIYIPLFFIFYYFFLTNSLFRLIMIFINFISINKTYFS